MGLAWLSGVDDGETFTTIELKINFFRPVARAAEWAKRKSFAVAERSVMWNATSKTPQGKFLLAH